MYMYMYCNGNIKRVFQFTINIPAPRNPVSFFRVESFFALFPPLSVDSKSFLCDVTRTSRLNTSPTSKRIHVEGFLKRSDRK